MPVLAAHPFPPLFQIQLQASLLEVVGVVVCNAILVLFVELNSGSVCLVSSVAWTSLAL